MLGAALGLANWGRIKKLKHKATYVSLSSLSMMGHKSHRGPGDANSWSIRRMQLKGCLPPQRPHVASCGEKMLRLGTGEASGLAFVLAQRRILGPPTLLPLTHCPIAVCPCGTCPLAAIMPGLWLRAETPAKSCLFSNSLAGSEMSVSSWSFKARTAAVPYALSLPRHETAPAFQRGGPACHSLWALWCHQK